jgi:uncharacterized protein YuzE
MKLQYYADTDTLSIGLRESFSVETSEIAPDVTVDFDADGNVVSIDIDSASLKVDLTRLEIGGLLLASDERLTSLILKLDSEISVEKGSFCNIYSERLPTSDPSRLSERERQT